MKSKDTSTQELLPEALPVQHSTDLRKFNKAEAQVTKTVTALLAITAIASQEELDAAMETMKSAKSVEKVIEDKRKELVKPLNDDVKRINDYAKNLSGKIPPAIDATKQVVLAFHQEEARKAKALRTKNREQHLITLGFSHLPTGDDSVKGNVYRYGAGLYLPMASITEDDDNLWNMKVDKVMDDIKRLKDEALQAKEAELEEAAFFGTDEDKAAIQEEISTIKEQPAVAPAPTPYFGSTGSKAKGLTKRWTFEVTDVAQVPRGYLQVDEKAIREAITSGVREIAGIRIYQDESITIR